MTRKEFNEIVLRLDDITFNVYEQAVDKDLDRKKINKAYDNWEMVSNFLALHNVREG